MSHEESQSHSIFRLLDRPLSSDDLQAGAEMAARPAELRANKFVRLLLFRLGDETAAVHANLLRRVTARARPTPIPHRSSGALRGVCNIRGELVLCADLRRLLGLPAEAGDPSTPTPTPAGDSRRMVVIGPSDNSWAFEVDALMGVENVDPSTFREPPITVEHSIGDFTLGVADISGRTVTILDGERILAGFKAGLA